MELVPKLPMSSLDRSLIPESAVIYIYIYNYTLRVQNCSAGRIVLPEFEPKTKLVVDFSSFLFESGVFVSVLNFIICSAL